jgi:sugar phosphate isomerase/epimerase
MPLLPLGAVIAFDFKKWNVDEEIALIHHAEIRQVQVYRNYVQGITAEHIRQVLSEAGLVPESLHGYIDLPMFEGPTFDLSAADPATRRAALVIARGEADFARHLGCRDVILHPVGPGDTAAGPGRPGALAEVVPALARVAEEADVRFLLENMPPAMFGADAGILRRIVDDVASPHLGLAYDSGHANIAGDPLGIIRTMGPRLWGVHLHDNDGVEDGHYLPGMGTVPFEEVARTLAEVRFPGAFMLEVYRDTAEVRRDLTPERLRHIRRLQRLASGLSDAA